MAGDSDSSNERTTLRYRAYEVLEVRSVDDFISVCVDRTMMVLIVANVAAVVIGTVPAIALKYNSALFVFEALSVAVFTAEYLARLWVSVERIRHPRQSDLVSRLRYMVTPMALVDLAAIIPFFLYFLLPDMRFLRVVRLFRLFKMVRYSPALVTLGRVISSERRGLVAALIVMMSLIVFSGSIAYHLERDAQPDQFGSIPQAMWWAIATLTTVGYGDVVPVTELGRVFGGMVMVFGLGMYALPIGIIASGFANEMGQRDFVITWHALVRVPLFSHLDPIEISKIIELMKARIVPAGQSFARIGDDAEDMFFILSGHVEVQTQNRSFTLGPGEYFGEIALLTGSKRFGSAHAIDRCHLMSLTLKDFDYLMLDNARIRQSIIKVVLSRIDRGTDIGLEISEDDAQNVRRALDRLSHSAS